MYVLKDYVLRKGRVYLVPGEYLCPTCGEGVLVFFDYCRRIVRYEGNRKEEYQIPRCRCQNRQCGKIHRMLPDFMVPNLQYDVEVIQTVINQPEGGEDPFFGEGPSKITMSRWKKFHRLCL